MAVQQLEHKTYKYTWLTTDTKPTLATHGTVPGSTGIDDAGVMWITRDGTNWEVKHQGLKEVRTTKVIDGGLGAYAVNDVVSNEDCCSTTATCWTFEDVVLAVSRSGYIVGAIIDSATESVTPALTLYLFNAVPTSNLIDNAPNTAPDCNDILKYIGKIDFPALESLGTTDSTSIATLSTYGNLPLPFKCATADADIYGILVTRTAFTQSAGDDISIILLIEAY